MVDDCGQMIAMASLGCDDLVSPAGAHDTDMRAKSVVLLCTP